MTLNLCYMPLTTVITLYISTLNRPPEIHIFPPRQNHQRRIFVDIRILPDHHRPSTLTLEAIDPSMPPLPAANPHLSRSLDADPEVNMRLVQLTIVEIFFTVFGTLIAGILLGGSVLFVVMKKHYKQTIQDKDKNIVAHLRTIQEQGQSLEVANQGRQGVRALEHRFARFEENLKPLLSGHVQPLGSHNSPSNAPSRTRGRRVDSIFESPRAMRSEQSSLASAVTARERQSFENPAQRHSKFQEPPKQASLNLLFGGGVVCQSRQHQILYDLDVLIPPEHKSYSTNFLIPGTVKPVVHHGKNNTAAPADPLDTSRDKNNPSSLDPLGITGLPSRQTVEFLDTVPDAGFYETADESNSIQALEEEFLSPTEPGRQGNNNDFCALPGDTKKFDGNGTEYMASEPPVLFSPLREDMALSGGSFDSANERQFDTGNEMPFDTGDGRLFGTSNEIKFDTMNQAQFGTVNDGTPCDTGNDIQYGAANEMQYGTANARQFGTTEGIPYDTDNKTQFDPQSHTSFDTGDEMQYSASNDLHFGTGNELEHSNAQDMQFNTASDRQFPVSNELPFDTGNSMQFDHPEMVHYDTADGINVPLGEAREYTSHSQFDFAGATNNAQSSFLDSSSMRSSTEYIEASRPQHFGEAARDFHQPGLSNSFEFPGQRDNIPSPNFIDTTTDGHEVDFLQKNVPQSFHEPVGGSNDIGYSTPAWQPTDEEKNTQLMPVEPGGFHHNGFDEPSTGTEFMPPEAS
ncbi:hypothetical protein QBC38DRAFT_496659 [Podospora fimiseda]|uniref:Uncharacterized protein n=1 Tax=Podospora fimiseda TaxID=252190 RepID=A0AAN7GZZ9_9PEZI|nr:hypothetical protein QBC38DRAFT_496659 [Podospora fimiseda]